MAICKAAGCLRGAERGNKFCDRHLSELTAGGGTQQTSPAGSHTVNRPPAGVPVQKEQTEDNWAHRSVGMRCATCMWWMEKANSPSRLGRCRKNAPTMGGFPATYSSDWCGQHKLDEAKA